MPELRDIRVRIHAAAAGSDVWRAVDLLPRNPTKAEAIAGEAPDDWAGATFGDLVLALQYCTRLAHAVAEGQPHDRPADAGAGYLTGLGYHSRETVPAMLSALRLSGACDQIALRTWRLRLSHQQLKTEPDDAEFAELLPQMQRWADPVALFHLRSPVVSGAKKLEALQYAAQSLGAVAAWLYIDLALRRWPSALDIDPARDHLIQVLVVAVNVANAEWSAALTSAEVWQALHERATVVGADWPGRERQRISAALTQIGGKHVAVFDPSFALSTALVGLVAGFNALLDDPSRRGDFELGREAWSRTRHRDLDPRGDAGFAGRQYSDFVVPSEGDGVWPASIVEVESVVRAFLKAVPEATSTAGAQGPVIGSLDERLFEVTPPTSIPGHLLETKRQQGFQAMAPLQAWMAFPASSSDKMGNVWRNHDLAANRILRDAGSDAPEKADQLGSLRAEVEAVVLPSLTSATALALLFDKADPFLLAVLAPTIYPLYKLFKKLR